MKKAFIISIVVLLIAVMIPIEIGLTSEINNSQVSDIVRPLYEEGNSDPYLGENIVDPLHEEGDDDQFLG